VGTPAPVRTAAVAGAFAITLLVSRLATTPAAASLPNLDDVSMKLGPWSAVTAPPLDPEVARTLAADRYVHRYYTGPGGAIEMDVAYYSQPRVGANMHSPLNCLPGTGWQMADVADTDVATSVGRWQVRDTIVERRGARYALMYWFQSDQRVVADEFSARVHLLGDALQRRRTDAGLVRLIMPITGDAAAPRAVLTSFATLLIPEVNSRLQ
jgi:EpsI family protein